MSKKFGSAGPKTVKKSGPQKVNADPWCSPTLTLKLSVVPTANLTTVFFPRTYPVQVARTFLQFLIFSYSTTALLLEPCRRLSLGPRIHKVDLFDLSCTFYQHRKANVASVVHFPGINPYCCLLISSLSLSLASIILSHIFIIWLISFTPL